MTLSTAPLTSANVPFSRWRRIIAMDAAVQAGVVGSSNAFKVSQRAAGANMSVDVAAGDIMLPSTTGLHAPGLAHGLSDAVENVAVTGAHATNPRVDQICARHNDAGTAQGDGGSVMTLVAVTGAPTAGATLDNRSGATALPAGYVRLADVLVPAASSSVVAANIRDRRPWAWGANGSIVGNGAGNQSTTATTLAAVPLHTTCRLEIAADSVVDIVGTFPTGGSGRVTVSFGGTSTVDALVMGGGAVLRDRLAAVSGSRQAVLQWAATSGTFTMANSGVYVARLGFQEVIGGQRTND